MGVKRLIGAVALAMGVAWSVAACQGTAGAMAQADGSEAGWSQLQSQVGQYQQDAAFLQQGVMAAKMQHLLGDHTAAFLQNLQVAGPLQQEGSVYFITGNRPHDGGQNAGAVALDAKTDTMRIWWLQNGQPRVVQDAGAAFAWPRDVNTLITNAVSGPAS